jgi:hypothetical protein
VAEDENRVDLEATVAARSELGPRHEEELIAGFLERVEQRAVERRNADAVDRHSAAHMRFVIALVSLGTGVPISAIAAALAGLPGLIVAWAGIVGVNFAARRS